MKMQSNYENLIKQITQTCKMSLDCIWIYGSCAINLNNKRSDVDILAYKSNVLSPKHIIIDLPDGVLVSINLFGENMIEETSKCEASGYYFPSRFLSPVIQIFGDYKKGYDVEHKSFSTLIKQWNFNLSNINTFQDLEEKILAQLYITKCKINNSFLLYFDQWYRSKYFTLFWAEKTNSLKKVLELYGSVIQGARKNNSHNYNFIQKQIILQKIAAQYWTFSVKFRHNYIEHITEYFNKNIDKASLLSMEKLKDCVDFLERKGQEEIRRKQFQIFV